jgi:NAD(P)-dependent dehydrogenase (short-subunit alcohol dehydrogenase family)
MNERCNRVAVVAGVGPGLGAALVQKLAREGCRIGMVARSAKFISKFAAELGSQALAVPTDISNPQQVAHGFRKVREKLGATEFSSRTQAVRSAGTWKRLLRSNSSVPGARPHSARSCVRAKPCPT